MSIQITISKSHIIICKGGTYDREREQQLKRFVDSSGTIFDCFLNNPAVRQMLVSSEGGSNADNVRSVVDWALKNDR